MRVQSTSNKKKREKMKKFYGTLSLLVLLLCASTAMAASVEKSGLRLDLPEGWSINESEGGNNIIGSDNVALLSPQGEAQIIISIFHISEVGSEHLAQGTSERLKGSTPEAVAGGYLFDFSMDGTDEAGQPFTVTGKTFVGGKGRMLGTVTRAGQSPQLEGVLASLQGIMPETEDLLTALRPGFQHILK